jgi:hypothetical protein
LATTSELLRNAAIEIVRQNQPCRPYDLLEALQQEHGASDRAANDTMFTLLRDGLLKRTGTGKLKLPG